MIADQGHGDGGMSQHVGVVRIELERPLQLPARALVVAAIELRHAENAMRPVIAIVELDRLARELRASLRRKNQWFQEKQAHSFRFAMASPI